MRGGPVMADHGGPSRRAFLRSAGAWALGTGAWTLGARARSAEQEDGPGGFSVAALNDLHIVDKASTALLDRAVDRINALPGVRFTVVLGDITEDAARGQFDLAKQALDRLEVPYAAVPGNHDVEGKGLAYSQYVRAFGARSWVRPAGGWTFIGLDSCSGSAVNVSIPVLRLARLREQVKTIPKHRPIALFAHHPFNPGTLQYRVQNADKVLALFAEHRLRLVATGHWHGNQVQTVDGVLFTTTACCSSTRNNHDFTPWKGFRVFHFAGDSVETEFVAVKEEEEAVR